MGKSEKYLFENKGFFSYWLSLKACKNMHIFWTIYFKGRGEKVKKTLNIVVASIFFSDKFPVHKCWLCQTSLTKKKMNTLFCIVWGTKKLGNSFKSRLSMCLDWSTNNCWLIFWDELSILKCFSSRIVERDTLYLLFC